jgi:hypothetical protein
MKKTRKSDNIREKEGIMRISEYYRLGRTQPTLDFVDVDIWGDATVFVDPRALRLFNSPWANECVALVQNFFRTVLDAIHRNADQEAKALLGVLHEPNETHLGLSKGKAQGRALGQASAADVWLALTKSEAARSGLLEDLEDTILMVEGISSDKISDITTNIIRGPLVQYTHQMARYYGIPLCENIVSGPIWSPLSKEWISRYEELPMTDYGKLLLVPKAIVRRHMDYDANEYYRHYILEHLKEVELAANTELVRLLKNGSQRVTKKDLITKYGYGKSVIVRQTLKYPEVLERYRRDKRSTLRPPLDHIDLADSEGTPRPDWDALLLALNKIPCGRDDSKNYEDAIESLLTALFYPSLAYPIVQVELHEGRKRVDISYTNLGTEDFFKWLALNYAAPNIFIECKNYSGDPSNPELDQLSGRFSPSRGQVGILVCRNFKDKELFLKRCRDTANDQRGYIITLDDSDLAKLVDERKRSTVSPLYELMWERFRKLIS